MLNRVKIGLRRPLKDIDILAEGFLKINGFLEVLLGKQ